MTNVNATRGIAFLGALTVALGACSDGRDTQARAAERGIVVAQATPETPVEPERVAVAVPEPTTTPRYTNVTYEDAESVFRKGRYEESAEMFGVYVESNPSNAFGFYMLGLSEWKSGDHEGAEQALTRAVELNGESVKIRTNLGRVLLELGRGADALPHLEKAVELDPTSHEVWRVLGNTYAQVRRNDEALAAYREALMLNDHDSWTMNNYGLLLIQLGRYGDALRPLARAVELVPRSATFQNNLGIALERTGELEGARSAFSAALEADSTYARAMTSLERVEARLVTIPMEAPDLELYSEEFIEEMRSWTSEEEHDC